MANRIEAHEAMLALVQEAAQQDVDANIDGRNFFAALHALETDTMTINSATDHGFNTDWSIQVRPGLVIGNVSAEGWHELRVHRAHRDGGYWECVWLGGPRKGGIWVRHERDILVDAYAH